MEVLVPANAFEWCENCPDCRLPMARVQLTAERIKIEPGTLKGDTPYPKWFYDWSQSPCIMAGPAAYRQGDHPANAFPTWYCARCITVWVVFRGLWFKTSFAPAVPAGIINAGDALLSRISPATRVEETKVEV
jgi:hypothetical protein